DEHAPLAAGSYLSPQDDLLVISVNAVFFQHCIERFRVDLEHRRHRRLLGAVSHRIRRGFVAQQQRQRIYEYGFSGAGFAGQEIETGGELHGDVVNDRVVFNPQFQQHSAFSTPGSNPSVAGKLPTVAIACKYSKSWKLTAGSWQLRIVNSQGNPGHQS